ncbi:uncharacterized protein LOC128406787 [Podarcis raffonei]|uniref:uncharacterized protein LOC128406787 n=1 Tax=Podarcis raffonei TaxID=65483 RepID=UPI002329617B|nr:uncharacterized protein LOC128406787 [Podarcis raffonei]
MMQAEGLSPKKVWICGHSIVHWAHARATESIWEENLGFPSCIQISWITQRGMRWHHVLPLLTNQISLLGPPDFIVFQVGENELGEWRGIDLTRVIVKHLETLHAQYPQIILCWSYLLERQFWFGQGGCILQRSVMNRARNNLNRRIKRKVQFLGGMAIQHPNITLKNEAIFRRDGVHLTDMGNDIWLSDLVECLRFWLQI